MTVKLIIISSDCVRVKKFLGFAFINYSSFEAADAALEAMNGQYLCNRPITIRFVQSKLGSISWDQKSFKILSLKGHL